MTFDNHRFENHDGSVTAWIEQEAIHMKAVEAISQDAVELTGDEARELAGALVKFAEFIDRFDR